MKTPKPDQLFKDKLRNHKISPPPGAWAAIEGNLQKRKAAFIYNFLKVAAVLLVLMSAAVLFFTNTGEKQSKPVASNNPLIKPEQEYVALNQMNQPEQKIENPASKTEDLAAVIPNQPIDSPSETFSEELIEIKIEPAEIVKVEDSVKDQPIHPDPVTDHKIVIEYIAASSAKKDTTRAPDENYGPVVVEYISNEENMVADKKEKAINKVIQFALELKNGEIGLAELREAKDELLSIEKEKSKTQNKDE